MSRSVVTASIDATPAGPWPGDLPPVSDAELEALALQADPDAPLAPDAVPIGQVLGGPVSLLPEWYMPAPMARGWTPRRVAVIAAIIAANLAIPAAGLCVTYGHLVIA